jgi:hypothetical protein
MLEGDIGAYVECAVQTLEINDRDCTGKVLSSVLSLGDELRSVLAVHPATTRRQLSSWLKPLDEGLRRWARGAAYPGRCACGEEVANLGNHFLRDHEWSKEP